MKNKRVKVQNNIYQNEISIYVYVWLNLSVCLIVVYYFLYLSMFILFYIVNVFLYLALLAFSLLLLF